MWHVATDRQMPCDVCDHPIQNGEYCISDLPEKLPKSVSRDEFRHFHMGCRDCERSGAESASCYQLLSSMLVTDKARQESICLFCGHAIHEGEDQFEDFFFVRDGACRMAAQQGPGALTSALLNGKNVNPTAYSQLTHQLKAKLSRAGFSSSGGNRKLPEVQEFYRLSVPGPVRNLGEAGVFTRGKHASHKISRLNAPHLANDHKNIIWESSKANLRRGSRNMTRLEIAKANGINAAHSAKIVGSAAAARAARGAVWAALIELPVSLVENGIYVYRGEKTKQTALKDTGTDVAKAGVTSGIFAGGIAVAVALGAGPALVVAGPVLIPAGVGFFAISSGSRIRRAWKGGLSRVDLSFHSDRINSDAETNCYQAFAEWVSSFPLREIVGGEERSRLTIR